MTDFRDYSGVNFTSEFLSHYGVGHDKGGHSGRYPWGSGEKSKSKKTSGSKWEKKISFRKSGSSAEVEMTKEEALKRGTAKDVLKFQGDLTNKELQDALTRIQLESKLRDIESSQMKRGKDTALKILGAIGNKIAIPMIVGAASYGVQRYIDNKFNPGSDATKKKLENFELLKKELFKSVNPPPKK